LDGGVGGIDSGEREFEFDESLDAPAAPPKRWIRFLRALRGHPPGGGGRKEDDEEE